LILIGSEVDHEYTRQVREEIQMCQLDSNITWLGVREDVPSVLRACDVGVLSSISEGLPLALLDYGMAGLPAVATAVGQCPEVLDGGSAGILVPPRSPESIAQAVLFLLESPKKRTIFGNRLDEHVRENFDPDSITEQISCIYHTIAQSNERLANRVPLRK
jgi:glycosyltransferase involved in cell wall biosynthesis